MKTITIAIGGDGRAFDNTLWHAVDTNAPVDYDGFGTFQVAVRDPWPDEGKGEVRTVLVRSEHYNWQTIRYHSGNHWFKETVHDEAAIAEELWNRLRGVSKPAAATTYTELDGAINRTVGFLRGLADGFVKIAPDKAERCLAFSKLLDEAHRKAQ